MVLVCMPVFGSTQFFEWLTARWMYLSRCSVLYGVLQKQLEEGNEDNAKLEEMLKAKQEHIGRLKREQQEQHEEKQQMLVQIQALEEEIRTLQDENNYAQSAPPAPVVSKNKVAKYNLSQVHERYKQVLQSLQVNHCSIRKAFAIAGISRSTVRDLNGIAELHLVDRVL